MDKETSDQLTFTNSDGTCVDLTEQEAKWADFISDRDRSIIEALCTLVLNRLDSSKAKDT